MAKVLVISPGVLPLPPILGGAVENLIARLHPFLVSSHEMHYVSVSVPDNVAGAGTRMDGGDFHYIESINPLRDFNASNHFELQESDKWPDYESFCLETVRRIEPDIIHIHNEARLAIALRNVAPDSRIIVHINDEVVTRLNVAQLAALSSSVNLVLSCSGYIRRQMERAYRMNSVTGPPTELFYNFVDCAAYDPMLKESAKLSVLKSELGLDGRPTVAFVGRLIEQKGPQLVMRALRWLRRRGSDANLLFVGAPWYSRATNTPWVDYLKSENVDLLDRMFFTGYIPQDHVPLYYALADVVTVPSIWDDPSPFVAYEGQAMALPVLASERGGIPEIVLDGETGRTIDVFNVPLFGQLLMDWLCNPDIRRSMGESGRQRILSRFTVEHAARQMTEIYDRLMNM